MGAQFEMIIVFEHTGASLQTSILIKHKGA